MVFEFYSFKKIFFKTLKNMKIIIFSKTKIKIKNFSRIKVSFIFNFTYTVQISLESVHK